MPPHRPKRLTKCTRRRRAEHNVKLFARHSHPRPSR
jgi:hypothetical protein